MNPETGRGTIAAARRHDRGEGRSGRGRSFVDLDFMECRRAAWSIRRELQERRCDAALLVELYRGYNPLADVEAFVQRALGMFPRLCCGLASAYARHRLGGGRIAQGRYGHEGHTFLRVRDWIVDLTADQFGGPEVYVGPIRSPWSLNGPPPDYVPMDWRIDVH